MVLSRLELLVFPLLCCLSCVKSLQYVAIISMEGLAGQVTFTSYSENDTVSVHVDVKVNGEDQVGAELAEYQWGIYPYPVDYTRRNPCHEFTVGSRPYKDLSAILGPVMLPTKAEFSTRELSMFGPESIWRRSVVLRGRRIACGTLQVINQNVTSAVANLRAPVAGKAIFNTLEASSGEGGLQTHVFLQLNHIKPNDFPQGASLHKWQIFVTDVLADKSDEAHDTCDFLQILFDPDGRDDRNCTPSHPTECKIGDMSAKHGVIEIHSFDSSLSAFTDTTLKFPDLEGRRSLYLVILDPKNAKNIYSCAKIREMKPKNVTTLVSSQGVKGVVRFSQFSPHDPTLVHVNLTGLKGQISGYHVHKLPVLPRHEISDPCAHIEEVFNPYGVNDELSPSPGVGTRDEYSVGDLGSKYGLLDNLTSIDRVFLDTNLPLFGRHSVIGRSLALGSGRNGTPDVCHTIVESREPIIASAIFRYPMVGQVVFRQPAGDPTADTTVYVEYLLYSDGAKNDTFRHRWGVHDHLPNEDFHEWRSRCVSAGGTFNPLQVSEDDSFYRRCAPGNELSCKVGDLSTKHELLDVVASKRNLRKTRRLFTDINLPLSGPHSIIGHSLVVFDDNGPKARGERLGCVGITRRYRHKAEVSYWYKHDPEQEEDIEAKLEFYEDFSGDPTRIEVQMNGLKGLANGYHVHMVPVPIHVDFPCHGSVVYGHYNPYHVNAAASPPGAAGSNDQYEVGDISGKFGGLKSKENESATYYDQNMALHGPNSIAGRSIVIHKAEKSARWFCGTIGWGFSPSEAREIRAIASFHYPNGFSYGYIRFRQVVYYDGSTTDTSIEVSLRYPGVNDKNVTTGHKWAIYVNPVGQDSVVPFYNTRCVAAGYRWNPYFTNLADPTNHDQYSEECGPDAPLRCEVGDLSGRLGLLTIGKERLVFNDINLPLPGDYKTSIIGKSVVILEKDQRGERMACANIAEDKDLVKWILIQKPPRFDPSRFVDIVREIMGVPEWMLAIEAQKTKYLHEGQCVQLLVHFMGPVADLLESEFNRLMRVGSLYEPTLKIPGVVPDEKRRTNLPYTHCKYVGDKSGSGSRPVLWSSLLLLSVLVTR